MAINTINTASVGAGGGGAFTFVAIEATEQTSTSTTLVDLATSGTISVAAGTRVRVVGKWRKSSGNASRIGLGVKINATNVQEAGSGGQKALVEGSATDQAEDGMFEFDVEPGETNYQNSMSGSSSSKISSSGADIAVILAFDNAVSTAQVPAATITAILIRGICGNSANTMAVTDIRFYTYNNS